MSSFAFLMLAFLALIVYVTSTDVKRDMDTKRILRDMRDNTTTHITPPRRRKIRHVGEADDSVELIAFRTIIVACVVIFIVVCGLTYLVYDSYLVQECMQRTGMNSVECDG